MALCSFEKMISMARDGGYAVGYFEPWNMESILAVTDAAEETKSPVIIGFCGDYLMNPGRLDPIPLSMAYSVCEAAAKAASVPVSILFNETCVVSHAVAAAKAGFSGVMLHYGGMEGLDSSMRGFIDEDSYARALYDSVMRTRIYGTIVEGEFGSLPASSDGTAEGMEAGEVRNAEAVLDFVNATRVGALSVSIGNAHLLVHGKASLDFGLFERVAHTVDIPLVIHGGSGISDEDVKKLVSLGMAKLNVGASLKEAFVGAIKNTICDLDGYINPNDLLGKGGKTDIMTAGRLAMKEVVLHYIELLGCAGKARRH